MLDGRVRTRTRRFVSVSYNFPARRHFVGNCSTPLFGEMRFIMMMIMIMMMTTTTSTSGDFLHEGLVYTVYRDQSAAFDVTHRPAL